MLFNRFVPVDEATGFYPVEIDYSCKFNNADSAYLSKQQAAGDSRRKWTVSFWMKRCNLGGIDHPMFYSHDNVEFIRFETGNTFTTAVGNNQKLYANQTFRDPTKWMHVCWAVDTEQATAADRSRLYVNGVELVSSGGADPTLNGDSIDVNVLNEYVYWAYNQSGAKYADCYLADCYFIDGYQLTPSSFGESKSGVWVPKNFSGTYGTNGHHLDFADSANLGNDVSGNNNDFTESGLTSADQVIDTPTNNHLTLSPIAMPTSTVALADGNLNFQYNAAGWATSMATMSLPKTGKWYFEFKLGTDLAYYVVGVMNLLDSFCPIATSNFVGADAYGWGLMCDGVAALYKKYTGGTPVTMTGDTPSSSDVMQVAIDMDDGKIWFGVNDTWLSSGNPGAGTNEAYSGLPENLCFAVSVNNTVDTAALANFGQLGFAHTPPTGFNALNSANMDDPTVEDCADGYHAVEWTGDASDDRNLGAAEFDVTQGALLWIKNKASSKNHHLYDTVRGAGEVIHSNDGDAEITENGNIMQAFITAGFQAGDTDPGINDNSNNYIAWLFRVAAAYGLDIVTYSGTGIAKTESHNLGIAPELILVKNLSYGSRDWAVYHHHALNRTDPETDYGHLNTTGGFGDSADFWNDTAPTTSVFSVGASNNVNESGASFVAFLFASIPQYLKVFSFKGNGGAAGPIVELDFRPAFCIIKKVNAAESWVMHSAKQNPNNPVSKRFLAESHTGEADDSNEVDFLGTAIKIRTANSAWNTSGGTYVGVAVADQPGKYSLAR